MTYQDVLKAQLNRRIEMNPRYSLRAFAKTIQMSPSKLSEVLSRKKGVSLSKANDVCSALKMTGVEKELFLLSVEAQHSRLQNRKKEAQEKIELLKPKLNSLKTQTHQKCAWYYGAVEAYLDQGISEVSELKNRLGITSLQIENAKRFLKRRAAHWPDRHQIRMEESSVLRKVQSLYETNPDQLTVEANFISATDQEFQELQQQIRNFIVNFKSSAKNGKIFILNLNGSEI